MSSQCNISVFLVSVENRNTHLYEKILWFFIVTSLFFPPWRIWMFKVRNVETPELTNSSRRRKSLRKWGKCGEDKVIKYSSWKYFINNWQSFTCLCHKSSVSFDIHMAWPTELSSLRILYKRCRIHYWHYSMHYIDSEISKEFL